jgi:zinc D-Ala-D-Ala carboxypeptidase
VAPGSQSPRARAVNCAGRGRPKPGAGRTSRPRERLPRHRRLFANEAALDHLQALRDRLGKPLIVRSAYRSPEHNRTVGGAKASKHLEGIAFDVAMANHDPEAFEAAARGTGFKGFGFYPRLGFIHIDLGPARSWGERFPKRVSAFAVETPPAREALADRRTLKGGGAAGVATVGAAGVEVAQEFLAETQGAILPLVPYLDALRSPASPSRSTRVWTIGNEAGDDRGPFRPARRRPLGPPRLAARPRCRRRSPTPPVGPGRPVAGTPRSLGEKP